MIETLPPGAQRDRAEAELEQIVYASVSPDEGELEWARHRCDELGVQLNQGCDRLEELAKHVAQDSPEYERPFAGWLQVIKAYEKAYDQLNILEARAELERWRATLPPPKRNKPVTSEKPDHSPSSCEIEASRLESSIHREPPNYRTTRPRRRLSSMKASSTKVKMT
jgi:hypothetical protein